MPISIMKLPVREIFLGKAVLVQTNSAVMCNSKCDQDWVHLTINNYDHYMYNIICSLLLNNLGHDV